MQSKLSHFNDLKTNSFQVSETTNRTNLTDVFAERSASYLNEFTLFLAHFNTIPNYIHDKRIDCKKANLWFSKTYKSEIKDWYYNKICFAPDKDAEFDDIFYFLYEDLIVDFDTNNSIVRFLFRKTEVSKVEHILDQLRAFRKRKARHKPEISLLVNTSKGIGIHSLKISKPKLSIEDNYNDDFKNVHQTIFKRLLKKDDKGLVLLHGLPGTGKTSYIRFLISTVNKEVIFLPPNMAGAITSPDLISIMISNPNSIFVIEDAENIVVDREKDGHSPVSALLNIADGLLSDCLNIQIICSFNVDLSKVDNALLRKGRLIAKYEFKELETSKAQALSNKLGFSAKIGSPMSLAAIYNQEEQDFQHTKTRNTIGFKSNNQERVNR